jgi:hypothetical protein
MKTIITFPPLPQFRSEDFEEFKSILITAALAAADQVGSEAMKSFFNDYKDSVDFAKQAA